MEPDLAQLNREVGRLETELAQLEIARAALAKAASRSSRRSRYLRFSRWLRKPKQAFHPWPLAVLLIGPLGVGLLLLVVASFLPGPTSLSIGSFTAGVLSGIVLFVALLYYPDDAALEPAIQEVDARRELDRSRLSDLVARRTVVNEQLQRLLDERQSLAKGDTLQRAMLLQRNWKAMRGAEWEDFLVEVCRTLGAHVERVANPAYVPLGPTKPVAAGRKTIVSSANHLMVTISPRRIAVAVVAGIEPFHPAAVQQTLNELAQHNVDASAIIVNTRITAGSKELAAHRRCTLVGETEFPDFVLGKISI